MCPLVESRDRVEQILHAAQICFNRKGYYRTTMDDIVAESGLSKGSLYWYFGSKQELFLALSKTIFQDFYSVLEAITNDTSKTATDKLRSTFSLFRREMEMLTEYITVVMEIWTLTSQDQGLADDLYEFYSPYFGLMESIIDQGITAGEFRKDTKKATAVVLMLLYDGIAVASGTNMELHNWDEVMDAAETLILRGLGVGSD